MKLVSIDSLSEVVKFHVFRVEYPINIFFNYYILFELPNSSENYFNPFALCVKSILTVFFIQTEPYQCLIVSNNVINNFIF